MIEITDAEFRLLKEDLLGVCGIEVPAEKRYLFVTRLRGFLEELGCRSFAELHGRLAGSASAELKVRLVEAMTTNETSFFRDGHPFEALRTNVLPTVARRCVEAATLMRPRLRLLSAGCSTGEEPYSIAMSVAEWLDGQDALGRGDVMVHGVDVSSRALAAAKAGVYPGGGLGKHMPPSNVRKYLEKRGDGLAVRDEIRAMVTFSKVNLAEPLTRLGPFDVAFCRNVIIYFSAELKLRVLRALHEQLVPGGVLFLGASESLYPLQVPFDVVHEGRATYFVKR